MRTRRCIPHILILVSALACAGGCGRHMMATPRVYCYHPNTADCFHAVPDALRGCEVDVLYVTDRLPAPVEYLPDGEVRYGSGRSHHLAFGSARVAMDHASHAWDDIVDTTVHDGNAASVALTLASVREHGRFPPSTQHGTTIAPPSASTATSTSDAARALQDEVRRRLAMTDRKDVFVYVHGVNNSFDDAVMAIGELWHFLGREGVPIAYTWPSRREISLAGYAYDRESGEFTVYHLKQFLRTLAACADVRRVHIVAHSRGTDVTVTALRELFIEARGGGRDPRDVYRIGNLVLAAPDMDVDVAAQRFGAERLGDGVRRVTMYVSENDKALGVASWLFSSARRLGRLGLGDLLGDDESLNLNLPNVDTIDVTARLDFLGHAYFTTSPEVSSDVVLLLRDDRDPGPEHGRPLRPIADGFWELPDGYPGVAPAPMRTAE